MPTMTGFIHFDPKKDIPSLKGKVVFVTRGTAGLGAASWQALARHEPEHVYFSGRNAKTAEALIQKFKSEVPSASITFLKMDLDSLAAVKEAARKFSHDRLDILMCNVGILNVPPALSKDGYETHFATNCLGHAMLFRELLPIMLNTAKIDGADVRIVLLSSIAWKFLPKGGIVFSQLGNPQEAGMGKMYRNGQSKVAMLLYAVELARRYPNITSVSVQPGIVETNLMMGLSPWMLKVSSLLNFVQGTPMMREEQGRLSQLWVAAGGKKSEIVNGAYYEPVGVMCNDKLNATAKDKNLAKELWDWTEKALKKIE